MADPATLAAAAVAPAVAAAAPGAAAGSAATGQAPTPTPAALVGPDGKLSVLALRKAYPMYSSLTDDQLLIGIHQKLYPDLTPRQFFGAVNYDTDKAADDPSVGAGTLAPLGIDTGIPLPQGLNRFTAGMGKTFSDVADSAKRVGNMMGLDDYTQQDAAADQAIAQPLMATGAAKAGKFAGDMALTALPMARGGQVLTRALGAIPGAAGVAGAVAAPYLASAGTGALAGAALTPDNMSGGAATGAVLGPAGELGGRLVQGAWQGGKAVLDPLTNNGRQLILQRTMNRFASDPDSLLAGAQNPNIYVPGYTPTLAEATGDTGIAQLQRAAQTMPDVASALSDANVQRVGAYRNALDDLAGNDGRLQQATDTRQTNAQANYGAAYGTPLAMTPELQATFDSITGRPSVQAAQGTAQNLAAETGMNVDNPAGSVAGLHFVKKALDDQVGSAMQSGNTAMGSAIGDTRDQFLDALRTASTPYANAMDQYAADSAPINQMNIGQALRDKMVPALGDYNDELARSRAQTYAQALRDSAGTASKATGMDNATLENTLTPDQMQSVTGIAQDAARNAQAQEAGKIPGSPTAQYLGAQNVMQQALGPLGMTAGGTDTALGRAAAGVLSMPFRATQSHTEELLARALRDPAVAAQILTARDAAPYIAQLQPYAGAAAVSSQK